MIINLTRSAEHHVQWPSFLVTILCYGLWAALTTLVAQWSFATAIILLPCVITLHSSLQHEVLHGHIFKAAIMRYLVAFPALGIFVPYERFRDTHLDHHVDTRLTDPYDDPESNFQDPVEWERKPFIIRTFYTLNNTLMGRMVFGPAISLMAFYKKDMKAIFDGETRIIRAYAMHGLGLWPVLLWLQELSPLSITSYLIASYAGMSILKIRTYLEHRAHENANGRSVIIEDRGLLSLLFLNNNYHALHHEKPWLAWYKLPVEYRKFRDAVLTRNDHYIFKNYAQIFRKFLLKQKDHVAHPLRSSRLEG